MEEHIKTLDAKHESNEDQLMKNEIHMNISSELEKENIGKDTQEENISKDENSNIDKEIEKSLKQINSNELNKNNGMNHKTKENKQPAEEVNGEKVSSKEIESQSGNKDKQTSESEESESEESIEKVKQDHNSSFESDRMEPHDSVIDYKNLKGVYKNSQKAGNQNNFYEKRINEKKEKEKKLEIIRKKKEAEAKNMAKPMINPESKKIMEKKQGYVKPIYERAKEIEETKKSKIETIKKTVNEKKEKEEEEVFKSKIINSNKHYDDKEFSKWRANTLEWNNKKQQKIENEKEKKIKQQEVEMSKYYKPNIHKTENNKSKVETNVHEKLYNLKDEKQKKLMQKIIESIPEFKPTINKKMPKFMQRKIETPSKKNSNINSTYQTNIAKSSIKSSDIGFNEVVGNYNSVSNSERKKRYHAQSMDYYTEQYTIESENESSGYEDDKPEPVIVQEEIINQYKEALEMTKKFNIKEKLRSCEKR